MANKKRKTRGFPVTFLSSRVAYAKDMSALSTMLPVSFRHEHDVTSYAPLERLEVEF